MTSDKTESPVYVNTIIKNARNIYSKSKKRHQTLFYKIVAGGGVDIVSQVISTLKSSGKRGDSGLLHWLMGDGLANVKVKQRGDSCKVFLKGVFLVPLWIILTPVFYLVHGICNNLLSNSFIMSLCSISKYEHLDFPIAFAVFSANKNMVELFLKHGRSFDDRDSRGNNVLHYVADLSRKNFALAEECYVMLKEIIPKNKLFELILQSRNCDHYNSIEYAAHFGSVQLALKLSKETMQEEILVVNNGNVALSADEQCNYASGIISVTDTADESKENSPNFVNDASHAQWIEKRINITIYEAFSCNGKCSYLLNLIMSRSALQISESELSYVNKDSCLQKWMFKKFKQWLGLIFVVAIIEIAFSLVLTLGVFQSVQGDFNLTPNKEKFVSTHTQVFLGLWKDALPTDAYYNLSQSFFDNYPDIETELSTGQDQMDYIELMSLIVRLPGYDSFDSSDMTSLYEAYCVTGSVYLVVGDLISIDNCTKMAAETFIVNCKHKAAKYSYYFLKPEWNEPIYEYAIATSFEVQVHTTKISIFRNPLRVELSETVAYFMTLMLLVYSALYIVLDIFNRLCGLFKQLKKYSSIYVIFVTPYEGSYVKGQAKCFSLFSYLVLICYYWQSIASFYGVSNSSHIILRDEILLYDRSTGDHMTQNFIMCLFFVSLFAFRIILHLNFIKILPWMGKFIITTFKLTVDLLHFTVVYVIIIFFFASLFHFVTRSEDCPDYRDDENFYVHTSIFSTFALTFGHVDFSYQNNAVKLAYVLFIVMSVILLLNLIIALMGTTASLITTQPWLPHLIKQAYVQEAIGLESWIYQVFGCLKVKLTALKAGGFVVEDNRKSGEGVKVYVEVFERIPPKE